jgi:hypothetical protein
MPLKTAALDGHAANLIVGRHEFVAYLHHQLKRYFRFLHGDHGIVNILIFSGGQVADRLIGIQRPPIDIRQRPFDKVTEGYRRFFDGLFIAHFHLGQNRL